MENRKANTEREKYLEAILEEKQAIWLKEIEEENLSLKLKIELKKIQLQILKREQGLG